MYISSPERTILYNDVVQYTIPNVGPSSNVNTLISSGIARLRGFLIVPLINATSNVCCLDGKQSPSRLARRRPCLSQKSKISNYKYPVSSYSPRLLITPNCYITPCYVLSCLLTVIVYAAWECRLDAFRNWTLNLVMALLTGLA